MIFKLSKHVRLRGEPFGSFIYFRNSQKVGRLNQIETIIAKVFNNPRNVNDVVALVSQDLDCDPLQIHRLVKQLQENRILVKTDDLPTFLFEMEWNELVQGQERISKSKPFSSPVWMHIQPWTICNLECKHCYCFASPRGVSSHLSEDQWYQVIDEFAKLDVFEMFITGGEVMIDERFWKISAYARKKDMVIRTTTNGTLVKEDTPDRLVDELSIDKIQVSLDGATPNTHDPFRGREGAFHRTINGIRRLRKKLDVSLEVTMHRLNYNEVNEIVELAAELGCSEVKFVNIFPTGRAFETFKEYQLSSIQKLQLLDKYKELEAKFPEIKLNYGSNCNDITQKDSAICTAGVIGANIDEKGNVLPCIMGISLQSLYAGNVLEKNFSDIWFHSPLLQKMRHLPEQSGTSCSACVWNVECKSRCSVIAHTTAQDPCHLSPRNPQSHFNTRDE